MPEAALERHGWQRLGGGGEPLPPACSISWGAVN